MAVVRTSKITHKQLVERGGNWLTSSKSCIVTIMERQSGGLSGESPDVLGWDCNGHSYLIECKVSLSDFYQDKNKHFRDSANGYNCGMGELRYYLCPKGLISPDQVPEKWGLLYATDYQIRTIKHPTPYNLSNDVQRYEIAMIARMMRDIRLGCIIVRPEQLKEQDESRGN